MSKQYIPGDQLSPKQLERVKAAFVHRDTLEHPWTTLARECLYHTGAVPTDAQWIGIRAFRFYKSGEVAGCLPLAAVTADQVKS